MNRIKLFSLTLSMFFLLVACAAGDEVPAGFDGIWRSVGYGRILKITAGQYEIFDVTQISCLPVRQGSVSEFAGVMDMKNDTLVFKVKFNIYPFVKIAEMPVLCAQETPESQLSDPLYNFEVFAQTFREHFAYFERNNIDWDRLYPTLRSRITPQSSEVELYLVLEEMLDSLHDNHGYVEPADEVYDALAGQQKDGAATADTLKEYGDFVIAGLVAGHFLEEDLTSGSRVVKWGKLKDSTGYLQVNAMMLHADLPLSDSLIRENGFVDAYFQEFEKLSDAEQLEAEVQGVSRVMDTVMKDLADTRCIIIDVRFNGGGNDDVGLEILRRFNPAKIQVATKKARTGTGYSREVPIFLDASETPYTNPVYLLTSRQSASATDFMAMATLELGHVKRIGSPTNGALSDALGKRLPNGWHFSLSNEVYLDNQGICYESTGIPVDYELNYPDDRQAFFRSIADDLEGDRQRILQAIEALEAGAGPPESEK